MGDEHEEAVAAAAPGLDPGVIEEMGELLEQVSEVLDAVAMAIDKLTATIDAVVMAIDKLTGMIEQKMNQLVASVDAKG